MGVERELMKGNLDTILLHILLKKNAAMSAMDIAKAATVWSESYFYINVASLYTALTRLSAAKFIAGDPRTSALGDSSRYYTITPTGVTALAARRARKSELDAALETLFNYEPSEVHD